MTDRGTKPDRSEKDDDPVPRRGGDKIIPNLAELGDRLGLTPKQRLEIRAEVEVIVGEAVSKAEARLLGEIEARTCTPVEKWREALLAAVLVEIALITVGSWLI